jgi:hypothetical protein
VSVLPDYESRRAEVTTGMCQYPATRDGLTQIDVNKILNPKMRPDDEIVRGSDRQGLQRRIRPRLEVEK